MVTTTSAGMCRDLHIYDVPFQRRCCNLREIIHSQAMPFGCTVASCYHRVTRKLILFGMLLCAAGAYSSPIPTLNVRLVSFNGPFVNGIPTFPYTISFAGIVPLHAMCDDYYHDGAPGDVWWAYLNNLATPNLNFMRFGNQGLIPYEEAGWLLLQTYVNPTSQWPDMNFAVWHIFNPTVPITANAQRWINLAQANYQGVDYSEVYILTPVQINAPPTGDQEFLFVYKGGTITTLSTPEPGSLALLGSGVLSSLAALRRRRKH